MKNSLLNHIARQGRAMLLAGICAVLIAGCGSGADSLTASGGIGGTGVTIGEVSDYGSIFVNDVEFDTRQADLYLENDYSGSGDQAVRDNLPIGQQVVIHGDFSDERSGTALQIDAFYRVQGPLQAITAIDDDSRELTVMGQTVYVDRQTTISGVTMEELAPDMVVRVSGPVDGDGAVHAGLITLLADADTVGVKGRVQALDPSRKTFRINGLTITYGTLQSAPAALAQDQWVAVWGNLDGDELEAAAIENFHTESIASAEVFLMDGFITGLDSSGLCSMGDYHLRLGVNTLFEGLAPEDLITGARIKVRGRLRDGLVQVDRVEAASLVRLESNVATVDTENNTLTLTGMNALSIRVNPLTRVLGAVNELSLLAPGDHVRVHAYAIDEQTVTARAIFASAAEPQSDRFVMQGPVTAVTENRFAVLGVAVDPGADGDISFWLSEGQPVTAEAFLNALDEGTIVWISGQWEEARLVYESMMIVR